MTLLSKGYPWLITLPNIDTVLTKAFIYITCMCEPHEGKKLDHPLRITCRIYTQDNILDVRLPFIATT